MYMTTNELEIMEVLWNAGRPLSRAEIIEFSRGKTWKASSIHILLNSMLEKGAIMEAGFVRCGKTYGRMFAPKVTCEEYYAGIIASPRKKPSIPKLFSALVKMDEVDDATISELEELLRQNRTGQDPK